MFTLWNQQVHPLIFSSADQIRVMGFLFAIHSKSI